MSIAWLRNVTIKKNITDVLFAKPLLLFSLSAAISVLASDVLLVSFKRYLYFLFESVLFFLIIVNSITQEEEFIKCIKCSIFALSIVAILGIFERYVGFKIDTFLNPGHATIYENIQPYTTGLANHLKDIYSTYSHRILFGLSMAIGATQSLLLVDRCQKKYLYFLAAILMLIFLYYSQSRGPWIAMAITSSVVFFLGRQKVKRTYIAILSIIVIGFLLRPGVLETIYSLYESTFMSDTIKGASYKWRYIVLNMAYEKIFYSESIWNLLFGYGQGSHLFMEFPRVELDTGHSASFNSWDNEYAVILLETGLIGTSLVVVFYVYILFSIAKVYFKNRNESYSALLLLPSSALLILLFMKTNVKFFTPQLSYIEFLNIAFISNLISKRMKLNIKSI